jgi:hypothetical protein
MNLEQFRKNKQLVGWAKSLFATENFKLLIEALCDSHPKNYRVKGEHIGDNAHYKLGRIDGYDEFHNNLDSAAIPEIAPENISSTFDKPN